MAGLINVEHLKFLSQIVKLLTDTLSSRVDAQVTASTDSDSDYAAEVVDARVDAWANENASLGTNIREGQNRLVKALQLLQGSFQAQLDEVAEAQIDLATTLPTFSEARRQDLLNEEESRVMDDDSLQAQIDELSGAILNIALQISEIRRNNQ